MTSQGETALQSALQLDREERAAIAARLLASLDSEANLPAEEWDRLWGQELDRRMAQIGAGEVDLIPSDEVHTRLRTIVQQHKRS